MSNNEMIVNIVAIVCGIAWLVYLMHASNKADELALKREIERRTRRLDYIWRSVYK